MKSALLGAGVLIVGALTPPADPHRAAPIADEPPLEAVLLPDRVVRISSPVEGLVERVLVDRGDVVERGQLLATLDFAVERANAELARLRAERTAALDSARARLANARRTLERQEALFEDGIVTAEELDATRSTVELERLALLREQEEARIAAVEYERAKAILAQSEISSPVDGVVLERHLQPGELLTKTGTPDVLTVADLDPLRVDVFAPIELWDAISVGGVATVTVDGLDRAPMSATVRSIDRTVDTASHTFRVRLELPNEDMNLPSGLRCMVAFPR